MEVIESGMVVDAFAMRHASDINSCNAIPLTVRRLIIGIKSLSTIIPYLYLSA